MLKYLFLSLLLIATPVLADVKSDSYARVQIYLKNNPEPVTLQFNDFEDLMDWMVMRYETEGCHPMLDTIVIDKKVEENI